MGVFSLTFLAAGCLLAAGVQEQEPAAPPPETEAPPAEQAPPAEPSEPAAEERRVDLLFEGALVGAKDEEDFGETPGYRRLLEIMSRYTEEELVAQAQREIDFEDALANPDAWRGELVHVRGIVAGMRAVKLSRPIGEHVDTYRAIVTETDGSEGVVVDFLLEPPELEIQRDVVEVEGVFYRTVRYENELDAFQVAPYLIARRPRPLDAAAPRRTAMDGLGKVLIGAAVAFVAIRVLMQVRRSRARAQRSERSEQARPHKPPSCPSANAAT